MSPLERELKSFIDIYVDSFEKWDLILFIAHRFKKPLSIPDISMQISRSEDVVESVVNDFTRTGLLIRESRQEEPDLFSPNSSYLPLIHDFAKASEMKIAKSYIITIVLQKVFQKINSDTPTSKGSVKSNISIDETNEVKEKCWQIVNGASSIGTPCRSCDAYLKKKQCWEIEQRPCTNSPAVCILVNCPVYLLNKEIIEKKLAEKNLLKTIEQVEGVAEKKCWQIRNCPPDIVSICSVKKGGINCWEVLGCVCSIKQKVGCKSCPIYIFHVVYKNK